MTTRKIVQISSVSRENCVRLFALCDDGTLWETSNCGMKWNEIPNVPDDKSDKYLVPGAPQRTY